MTRTGLFARPRALVRRGLTAVIAIVFMTEACAFVAACGGGAGRARAVAHAVPGSAGGRSSAGRSAGRSPPYGPASHPSPRPSPAATAAPDAACKDAVRALHILQISQGKDKANVAALDQDFIAFASRLGADAQKETDPAAVRAMTALANDYMDLVESQTGAAELPDMTTVQDDGEAFDRACGAS